MPTTEEAARNYELLKISMDKYPKSFARALADAFGPRLLKRGLLLRFSCIVCLVVQLIALEWLGAS